MTYYLGWIIFFITLTSMTFLRYGLEENLTSSSIFPAFARLIWSLIFSFGILATTTQFNESNFFFILKHLLIFYFLDIFRLHHKVLEC